MPEPLTDRQRAIYDFIVDSFAREQRTPTLREIGARFDIRSTNGVAWQLDALVRKGWLKRDPLKSRAIRIVELPPAPVSLFPGGVLACPFCGCGAVLVSGAMGAIYRCIGCKVLGPPGADKEAALEKWNMRA